MQMYFLVLMFAGMGGRTVNAVVMPQRYTIEECQAAGADAKSRHGNVDTFVCVRAPK